MQLRFGILAVSDRSARRERPALSGPALVELVTTQGWTVVHTAILADDLAALQKTLIAWADDGQLDLILTTGGAGFAPRDVTPEATRAVIEREAPGLVEAMRAESLKIIPHAMLSRAVAGIRRRTLMINLPGNPKVAVEYLQVVLPVLAHAIELLCEESEVEKHHYKPRWLPHRLFRPVKRHKCRATWCDIYAAFACAVRFGDLWVITHKSSLATLCSIAV